MKSNINMILKKYRNELMQVVLESGLDVNQFKYRKPYYDNSGFDYFETSIGPLIFRVRPRGENLGRFDLEFSKFAPGFRINIYPNSSSDDKSFEFDEVRQVFASWIQDQVKPYLMEKDYPDYWEIIKQNPIGVKSIDFTENEPFKEEERELLNVALDEIKGLLRENFDLNRQQLLIAEAKIHYLKEALKRLNKTDWKGILFTTIFTISYDLSFNTEKREMLYGLFSKIWLIVQNLPPHINIPPL